MKILIVEDEPELAKDISTYLQSQNYVCEIASTSATAAQKCDEHSYDCIILDLMLPDGTGLDLLRKLKQQNRQEGIVILSAKNSLEDRLDGLQLGADDYLQKPFHHAELAARIFSVIRRRNFNSSNTVQDGQLVVDLTAGTVEFAGTPVVLTKKELDLLLLFLGNKEKVISKSAIAEYLSGDFADTFDNHDFVYAHLKNLKKKLRDANAPDQLKTIYATGYRWQSNPDY